MAADLAHPLRPRPHPPSDEPDVTRPGVPVPVLLPEKPVPPCSLQELLTCRVPTLRHVPSSFQREFSDALASYLHLYSLHKTDEWLFGVLSLPKLVLRATTMQGKNKVDHLTGTLRSRLGAFLAGDLTRLWDQLIIDHPNALNTGRPETRARKKARTTQGPVPSHVLAQIRQLLHDGAAKKALQLLNSIGTHDPHDPAIWLKLQSLHPAPKTRMPESLPEDLDPQLGDGDAGFWDPLVSDSILRFPRGSAPGPSGLRPAHLQDAVR